MKINQNSIITNKKCDIKRIIFISVGYFNQEINILSLSILFYNCELYKVYKIRYFSKIKIISYQQEISSIIKYFCYHFG